jgi:hypothetical protein
MRKAAKRPKAVKVGWSRDAERLLKQEVKGLKKRVSSGLHTVRTVGWPRDAERMLRQEVTALKKHIAALRKDMAQVKKGIAAPQAKVARKTPARAARGVKKAVPARRRTKP